MYVNHLRNKNEHMLQEQKNIEGNIGSNQMNIAPII